MSTSAHDHATDGDGPRAGDGAESSTDDAAEPTWAVGDITAALTNLRARAGSPSFAEIARRVGRQRQHHGLEPAAARIARTTVYDCFRTGRKRISPDLVGEIVQALTGDATLANSWRDRCAIAMTRPAPPPAPDGSPDTAPPEPAAGRQRSPGAATAPRGERGGQWPSARTVLAIASMCILVNLIGPAVQALLARTMPLYLDMIGTAIAAIVLGPWLGAAVGVVSNVLSIGLLGPSGLMFAVVQVVGALIWGFGARCFGLARTVPRYVLLNLATAVACSVTAVVVLVVRFQGQLLMASSQGMADAMHAVGMPAIVAVFLANLFTSVGDKLLAGFVAISVMVTVLRRYAPPDVVAIVDRDPPSRRSR